MFSKKSVEALNEIVTATNAGILLTTSHKSRFSKEDWVNILERRDVIVNKLSKLSEIEDRASRLEEVKRWYISNDNLKQFVILDDDKSLNDLSAYLKSRLVLTKPLIGLTNSHVKEVIAILNTPLEYA